MARGAPGAHSRFTVVLPYSFFSPTKKEKRLAEHIHETLKTIEQALIYTLSEVNPIHENSSSGRWRVNKPLSNLSRLLY